ncbi:hypothetical protein [Dyella acidiphila]|uniref:DUF2946 domain-containing protein n=1 Tax=Dyella acidiphila TaxID=2775866 RepID=A0ABR9GF15_9GAMM|nr:hypothetical protein [Dyella acidiphila]MBE1162564.1 hypothetical protein [Dyella acidiphila]
MFLRRTSSLLLTLCIFIALVLMNGSAFAHVQMHADASPHGVAPQAAGVTVLAWQNAGDADACGDCAAMQDSDSDDEPALLFPLSFALDYLVPAAPVSAAADTYSAPSASLLRPPRFA